LKILAIDVGGTQVKVPATSRELNFRPGQN
jgi:hexokinase